MTNFNSTRFGKLLLATIGYNCKSYVQTAAAFAVVILFMASVSLLVKHNTSSMGYVLAIESLIGSAATIWMSTCLALIVSDISTKPKRIAVFMIPASKPEKFAARWVHLMIFIPLVAFVGILASDFLQMLLSLIVIGEAHSIITGFADTIDMTRTVNVDGSPLNGFTELMGFFYTNSLFLIFGTIFRRHAWIKSCILMITSFIVLLIIGVPVVYYLIDMFFYDYGIYDIDYVGSWWTWALWYGIPVLFIVFNYRIAYYMY